MQKRDPLGWKSPESQRLRWVRTAEGFGENSAGFAKRAKIGVTAYSQYENGVRLSRDAAEKIANVVPGLTIDYLLREKLEGMPPELRKRIEEAKEKEREEATQEADKGPLRGNSRA